MIDGDRVFQVVGIVTLGAIALLVGSLLLWLYVETLLGAGWLRWSHRRKVAQCAIAVAAWVAMTVLYRLVEARLAR